jgi:type IV pilus assembly protein PilP
MMRRHAIEGFVGGVLMLLLAGGTGAEWSWAAEVKAPPPAAPKAGAVGAGAVMVPPPAVAPTAPPTYRYNPAGKADPFVPFIELDLAAKKAREKRAKEEELKKRAAASKRPISPLQQAEIGQFRLVGIAGDEKQRMAIVEDSVAKKYYSLFVGTYIGLNGGRIISILPDRLIVEEPLQEESGKGKKVQTRRMTVMLHKEEEGKP